MDIEKLATSALKNSIAMTDVLSEFINDGDKEPSWDGNIYIYADKSKNKKGIKRVPVQVKGQVRRIVPPKKEPKYSVSVTDLDNWLRDGGLILFVVLLSENGKESSIFFRGLTPVLITRLKKSCHGKKWITVPLKSFPENNNEKTKVLLNFYEHMKKQASFANKPLYTADQLKKEGLLDSITISTSIFGATNEEEAITSLLSGDVYLYANAKCFPIPLPLLENPSSICFVKTINGVVSSNGIQYYSSYRLIRRSEGVELTFGKCITLKMSNDKSSGICNYTLSDSLSDNIRDTECFVSILKSGSLVVNGVTITISTPGHDFLEKMEANATYYRNVSEMLQLLGVHEEIDLSRLSRRDENNIRNFTDAMINGKLIIFPEYKDDHVFGFFPISNLSICIWATKQGNAYRLENFFSDQNIYVYADTDFEHKHPCSITHYALLKKEHFLNGSNIDYAKIREDIAANDTSPLVITLLIQFMLEMLKAYDEKKEKDIDLLQLADDYCSWLESLPENTSDEDMKLNRLQITKRKRQLNSLEIDILQEFRKANHALRIRCGANLLLDRFESAQDCFDEMEPVEQASFLDYPICSFGNLRKQLKNQQETE